MFSEHKSKKGLISKIYKELLKINKGRQKRAKVLSRYFIKDDIWMTQKTNTYKRYLTSMLLEKFKLKLAYTSLEWLKLKTDNTKY